MKISYLCLFLVCFCNAMAMQERPKTPYDDMPTSPDIIVADIHQAPTSIEQYFAQHSNQKDLERQPHITITIPKTTLHRTNDSEDTGTEDSIPLHHHKRRMIYSNGITAVIVCCVTSGVALAIHFIK